MLLAALSQAQGTIVLQILAPIWFFGCFASYLWFMQAKKLFLRQLQLHAGIRILTLEDPTGHFPITFSSHLSRGERERNRPLFFKQWPYPEVEHARQIQWQRWWFFMIVWLGGVLVLCVVGILVS